MRSYNPETNLLSATQNHTQGDCVTITVSLCRDKLPSTPENRALAAEIEAWLTTR